MGFDARLKRFFPLVVLFLMAVAAYFQAQGLGQIVASTLGDAPPPPPLPAPKLGALVSPGSSRDVNGAAILARNPFDSVTGPLDGKPVPTATAAEDTSAPSGDPYADPVCSAGKVLLITAADDPAWSFAAIADASGGKATLRRIGDDVGGKTVQAMVWDRVWLMQGNSRCQLPLHEAVAAAGGTPPPPLVSGEKPPIKPPSAGTVPKEIAEKITKISDTHFSVERSVVDTILERQGELFKSVRISPDKAGGGLKLGGIRPGSLLGSLGMQNGDKLESINGFEMGDPTKALEAYTRLRSADKISVRVNRGGAPTTIDIDMR